MTWSVKALLYVIRIVLTRETKWCQLEVCILFRSKVMIKFALNWHSATLCAGQPEDRMSEDSGGGEDGRLEESAATGGSSGPRGAAARPVRLESPLTEVRDTGRVLSAGAGGEGMGRGASQDLCRGGGARRTSSVPPGQRNGMEARADPDEMRHLSAGEGTRGREGASSESHPVVPSIQLGGPKGPGTRRQIHELVVVSALSSLIGAFGRSVTYVKWRHLTGRG